MKPTKVTCETLSDICAHIMYQSDCITLVSVNLSHKRGQVISSSTGAQCAGEWIPEPEVTIEEAHIGDNPPEELPWHTVKFPDLVGWNPFMMDHMRYELYVMFVSDTFWDKAKHG